MYFASLLVVVRNKMPGKSAIPFGSKKKKKKKKKGKEKSVYLGLCIEEMYISEGEHGGSKAS